MQVAAPTDIVVIALLEVQIGTRLGTMSFCIPHLALEPIMHRLSAQVWVISNRRRATTPESREMIGSNLRLAPVEVAAVLGETTITVDELLRLRPGDVLVLGPQAATTATLRVVNQPKFSGVPGVVGGKMAVRITAVEGESHGGG